MHAPRARYATQENREEAQEKLEPAVVLYFSPEHIGEKEGACCGACMMYVGKPDGKGHCTVVEGAIDGPHGICGLYVHGEHSGPDMKAMMPKEMAGYVEDGPTQCGNCEYFDAEAEACEKVAGHIEAQGCCNALARKRYRKGF